MAARPETTKREWRLSKPILAAAGALLAATTIYLIVPLAAIGEGSARLVASLIENRSNTALMTVRYSPSAPMLAQSKKSAAKRQIETEDQTIAEVPVHPEDIQVTPIYPPPTTGAQTAKENDPEPVAEQAAEPEVQSPAPATVSRAALNEDDQPRSIPRSHGELPASLQTPNTAIVPPPSGPTGQHAYAGLFQPIVLSEEAARKFLISDSSPIYPEEALRAGVQGAVVLQAWIAKDGSVQNLKLVRGYFVLGRAAFDAVKQWRFKPYYMNGQAVEMQTFITVDFKLPSLGTNRKSPEADATLIAANPPQL